MGTTGRSSSYLKAAVCAVASVTILLAGGSTYALWSQEGTVDGGEETITDGAWEWSAQVGDIAWFDTSPELDAGDDPATWGPADQGWENTWTGPWDAEVGGFPIDPATFHIVPGDTITGRFTIEAAVTDLDGQNLRAQLTDAAYDGAVSAGDPLQVVGDTLDVTVNEGVATATVEVTFPDDPSNDYESQAGGSSVVSLGDYSITITQVRP
ncbi:hypothetical protein [Xylanimonas ulmi]|uniref:Alternate signal-mediated exported protein n=1 Tax=Xylanimonas ulmi TaxID=228973 RepID=A0A4Q7M0U0_9MICO|nr:hypothetical protein [Xylanibacterium ulmi]RZS60811.1 alternate signal-mediated exported protein [Xylanibacterium ulmi]